MSVKSVQKCGQFRIRQAGDQLRPSGVAEQLCIGQRWSMPRPMPIPVLPPQRMLLHAASGEVALGIRVRTHRVLCIEGRRRLLLRRLP